MTKRRRRKRRRWGKVQCGLCLLCGVSCLPGNQRGSDGSFGQQLCLQAQTMNTTRRPQTSAGRRQTGPQQGSLAPESNLGPSSSRHRGPEEASPVSILEDVGQDAGEQPCAVQDSLLLLLRGAAGVGALHQPLHRLRE